MSYVTLTLSTAGVRILKILVRRQSSVVIGGGVCVCSVWRGIANPHSTTRASAVRETVAASDKNVGEVSACVCDTLRLDCSETATVCVQHGYYDMESAADLR